MILVADAMKSGARRKGIKMHDHNTATCETCKSCDDYVKEQYAGYEKRITELKELGKEVVKNLENMHGEMHCIKAWRKAAGIEEL
jgi:hypothetical protein